MAAAHMAGIQHRARGRVSLELLDAQQRVNRPPPFLLKLILSEALEAVDNGVPGAFWCTFVP